MTSNNTNNSMTKNDQPTLSNLPVFEIKVRNITRNILTKIKKNELKDCFDPDLTFLFPFENENTGEGREQLHQHIKFFLKHGNLEDAGGLDVVEEAKPQTPPPSNHSNRPTTKRRGLKKAVIRTFTGKGAKKTRRNEK